MLFQETKRWPVLANVCLTRAPPPPRPYCTHPGRGEPQVAERRVDAARQRHAVRRWLRLAARSGRRAPVRHRGPCPCSWPMFRLTIAWAAVRQVRIVQRQYSTSPCYRTELLLNRTAFFLHCESQCRDVRDSRGCFLTQAPTSQSRLIVGGGLAGWVPFTQAASRRGTSASATQARASRAPPGHISATRCNISNTTQLPPGNTRTQPRCRADVYAATPSVPEGDQADGVLEY